MSLANLTARECNVLQLIATGAPDEEIARRLVVSVATAKRYVRRVVTKLGLRDRAQVVIFAYECGLVRPAAVHRPDSELVRALLGAGSRQATLSLRTVS